MKIKSGYLRGFFKACPSLFILALLASMTACEPSGDEIGALVQPDPDDFAVSFSDTASVQLSTVAMDSMMTGSVSRVLVGSFVDPYFGKVQASSFFQPTINSAITIDQQAVYDSLVLSLYYDRYTYGDTTKPLTLSVHQLQSDILDKSIYFNSNSTPFNATPLGSVKLAPRPVTTKRLIIRLSDLLGKDIFDKAKANQITSNTEWINLVKGLVLRNAAAENASVIGFGTDSTSIKMYFHTPQIEGVKKDSTVMRTTAIYNQMLSDRRGTQIANLPVNKRIALPTSQTGNTAFMQSGTGIMTRVDLPTIRQLRAQKYIAVNRAFLRITPKRFSVTDQFRAPVAVYVYRIDKNNENFLQPTNGFPLPLYSLTASGPSGGPLQIAGGLTRDLNTNKEYYLLDVTSFVTELLTSETGDVGSLLLRTSPYNESSRSTAYPDENSEFAKSYDRLIFGDQQSDDPGVKLEVYYTKVNAQ
jgi:hypothetical protein